MIAAIAGVGLRDAHAREIDETRPAIGWLEVHSENFFGHDPARHRRLERLRERYPLSLHGVGLSLGSAGGLHADHLSQVAALVERYQPALVSEHVCWGAGGGRHSHQLLPLPWTREALDVLVANVMRLQEAVGRRVALEPVAAYLRFGDADFDEAEFLNALVRRTGCGLLLDVGNLHLNACNHGFDARAWLRDIDAAAVVEIHLAGFEDHDGVLLDTHDRPIDPAVWTLYEAALAVLGPRPTLIERDANLPPLSQLLDEMRHADRLLAATGAQT